MRYKIQQKLLGSGLVTLTLMLAAVMVFSPRAAITEEAANPAPRPEKVLVEIYRVAPGKHEAFLREIDSYDEANARAGLPPRQLYVHSDGASWDFMLIQPAKTPEDKDEVLAKAWKELNLPSGVRFFLNFRENIAEHSDTFAYGPTSAGAVLESIKE